MGIPKEAPATKRRVVALLWQDLRRLFALSKPYWKRLAAALLLSVLATGISLVIPLGLRELMDTVFEEGNRALLDQIALGLLVLFIIQAVAVFGGSYWLTWTGERVVTDLRYTVYAHLHRLSVRYFNNERTGDLTSRLTNDVSAVRLAATDGVVDLISHTVRLAGSVALMLALNWRLSLLILLIVPVASFATRYFGEHFRLLSRRVQDRLADTTAIAEEAVSAIRVVKAFARTPYEVRRYLRAIEALFEVARHRALLLAFFSALITLLFFSGIAAIFWYGGLEVLEGRLTAGDLVAFFFYALNVSRGLSTMASLYATFNSAIGASERLFEILDTTPEIQDGPDATVLPLVQGRVGFEGVTFEYEKGTPVLRDVTFEVWPGETIAFVGPSGAGKTTLMNLIPRFFDPTSGRILIDGQDLRSVQVMTLRKQIGVVAQDVQLFNDTIRENIRYGCLDASDEEVEQAAQDANAHTFILGLPQGYETKVGERGVKLSGGQRQRIAIARALLKDARILLLDEATSALDSSSEVLVKEALERLMQNRTSFVIAHRLATVRDADCIFVLDQGRIVEAGTHIELTARGGLYREMAAHQFDDRPDAQDTVESHYQL